ncbi:MAG: hypothetical protein LBK02_02245 [Treponema sp.]|jgi:hypothetical protein|nr:hypothetical protein [Treponema sp.]
MATNDYDFANCDPDAIMTSDEQEHFEEAMRFMNTSVPAETVTIEAAVKSTIAEMNDLIS